jgi:hypothetical protein
VNILIFGPNGSGKGTQGAIIQKKYGVPHIETGVIFRQNISQKTPLGEKAKAYIDRGELVPDDITIPMILNRLKEADCKKGWLLDGFPRNLAQAEALWKALEKEKISLDYVIEIDLTGKPPKSASWDAGCAKWIIITPIIFTSMRLNLISMKGKQSAEYAPAKIYQHAPMIRTLRQSINAMAFIMTPKPEHLPRLTILKKEQR